MSNNANSHIEVDDSSSDSDGPPSPLPQIMACIMQSLSLLMTNEKIPQRTFFFIGHDWVVFLMDNHPGTIVNMLRMEVNTSQGLALVLVSDGLLEMKKMRFMNGNLKTIIQTVKWYI